MKKIIVSLCMVLISFQLQAEDKFPGREIYPQVPYIELDELYKEKANVVFIDARSSYEFTTLRIKNAISIPLTYSSSRFSKELNKVREQNPGKKIVFYCNGHKCMKSYKAVKRAIAYVGIENIYAFDAGIFDWAEKYPAEALLLGKQLDDPNKLISKDRFKNHILPAEKFIRSATEEVELLDIRDRIERDGFYIFSGHETSISLDTHDKNKLREFFKRVKDNKKPLYVYDMVGKQVRWFQYYIEEYGIKEYYFMEGGADAFFKLPISKLMDS